MTSSPHDVAHAANRSHATVAELFRGVPPISSVDDLAVPEVFETDAELEEFLTSVRADRHADLA